MAPPTLMLAGLGLALAFWLVAWRAWHLCLAHTGAPWVEPWSASEGDGSPGGGPPPEPELTIAEIWAFRPEIIRWVLRRGVPVCDVEDVAQVIIDGAWRARRRWNPHRCPLYVWLFVITRNHVNTYLERACVRYETPVPDPLGGLDVPDDPEAAVEQKEFCKRALAILDRLPEHLAAVWLQYEVEETPASVIAEELGTPLSTVWGQLVQARGIIAREVARENAREATAMTRRRGRPE
jgi:RNA polymerase sigma-70 factor (ECF subfamily)